MAGRSGGRKKPDHYSLRARQEGYSARSVYKLQEIQNRYRILRSGSNVLDVGAAPGSWTQYARGIVGPSGRIVAVDQKPIEGMEDDPRVVTIVGDVFDESTTTELSRYAPFDCIISDAAPSTTGNRSVDTLRSAALVEHVIAMCADFLAPGGSLVAKVFQGGEEQALLGQVRAIFGTGRMLKPKASRSESFEAFVLGTGYTPNR